MPTTPKLAGAFDLGLFLDRQDTAAPTVQLLSAMACIFSTAEFDRWLWSFRGGQPQRFHWASHRFFDEVRRRLFAEVNPYGYAPTPHLPGCPQLAAACDSLAEKIADNYELQLPPFFGKSLEFQESEDALALITQWLGAYTLANPVEVLRFDSGDLARALHALSDAALMRRTLLESTGHAGFEAVLAELNEDWLIRGNFLPFLGSDAESFRAGLSGGQHILFRDACETFLSKPEEIPPATSEWDESNLPDDEYPIYPPGRLAHDKPYIIVHYGTPQEVLSEPGYVASALAYPESSATKAA